MATVCQVLKIVVLIFGGALIITGPLIKWVAFPSLLKSMVEESVQLDPVKNEEIYDTWVEPTAKLPVFMKFYVFNVTNPDKVQEGEKPILEEVGPFAYREIRKKIAITETVDEITFGSYIEYHFDEAESCATCKKDTQLTVVNAALTGLLVMLDKMTKDLPESIPLPALPPVIPEGQCLIKEALLPAVWTLLDKVVKGELAPEFKDGLFVTEEANNLIFEGFQPGVLAFALFLYELPLLDLGLFLYSQILTQPGVLETCTKSNQDRHQRDIFDDITLPPLPDIIADGKFAFFKGQNATAYKGWYKINSGKRDITQYQYVKEFNGETKLPLEWWPEFGPTPTAQRSGLKGICHDIIGTEGTQYPPFVNQESDIWLFSSQLCRSIALSYKESIDMNGVEVYKYQVDPYVLSFSNPDNFCFCRDAPNCAVEVEGRDEWDMSNCTDCHDAMIDLEGCQGAPVWLSLPHFMNADPSFLDNVIGLSPNPEIHTTYVALEPMTGVSLDAHKRIQVNVPVKQFEGIDYYAKVMEIPFPVVWADEGAKIGDEDLDDLYAQLVTPIVGVNAGVGVMIALGCVLVSAMTFASLCGGACCSKKKKSLQRV